MSSPLGSLPVWLPQPLWRRRLYSRKRFSIPPPGRPDQADRSHDVRVPDPYRWLEDDPSPETAASLIANHASLSEPQNPKFKLASAGR
jgi:hypothetical protein